MELKPIYDWNREGRFIKRGEKAHSYALNPDPDGKPVRLALFTRDQTEAALELDYQGWDVVLAADAPPVKQPTRRKGKHVIMRYSKGRLYLWCGSNEECREVMKDHKFRFNPRNMRYYKDLSKAQYQGARKTFENRGFEIVDEAEGDQDF
jgi:hypothetical protein